RPALLLLLLLLLILLLFLIAAFDSQSSGALPFERRDARGRDRQCLILEPVGFDYDARLRCEVENLQVGLRDIDFARHGVAIGFERRARLGERIDHPEVGDLALVVPVDGEFARVLRPVDADRRDARSFIFAAGPDLPLLFFGKSAGVAEILFAVGGDL